jgi:hypothetical protein
MLTLGIGLVLGATPSLAVEATNYYEDSNGNICVGLEFPGGFPAESCAMKTITTGINNTGIGEDVLSADSEGSGNTAIGYLTLHANTKGSENTAIGSKALTGGTEGNQDVAVGSFTMEKVTTATKDTAIGVNALKEVTTGGQDTAVGLNAMLRNISGEKDAAFGATALASNTSGERDVAVGYEAGVENTSGKTNTAIGYAALNENRSGSENTAVGTDALPESTHAGSMNTGLGFLTGFENEGSGNVFLGYDAGYHEKGSNKLYIANSSTEKPLIYGDFETKVLAVNGRLEPGEAAAKPAKPAAGKESPPNEISTTRKRSCAIVGNEVTKTFKCEIKLGTRLIGSVTVQKAGEKVGETEEPNELESATNYTTKVPNASTVEVTFVKAPASGAELFITVTS